MLLDTGATHSAITADVAAATGARTVATSNVISPAAETIRPIVAIDELSLGPDHRRPRVAIGCAERVV